MNVFYVLREKLKEKAKIYIREEEIQKSNPCYQRGVYGFKAAGYDDAIEIVNQVEQEYNNGWIPCTRELPSQPKSNPEFEGKPLELYLVSMNDSKYPWRAFWNGKDFTDGWRVVYPTAWQPLPPKYEPKGE